MSRLGRRIATRSRPSARVGRDAVRRAAFILAGAVLGTSLVAAPVASQQYGQPYPLNQYPQQAPGYQAPYPQQPLPAPVPLESSPAASGQLESREGIALQNQILELRRDMQGLQSQRAPSYGRAAPPGAGSDLLPQLLDRVSTLEETTRRLRGQVEDLQNQVQQQQRDFGKQLGDLQFRMQAGAAPPGAPGPSTLGTPPDQGTSPGKPDRAGNGPPPLQATPRRTPELAMQEGNAALARRDYGAAEASAREVLGAARNGPRAGDAQFLLAQALAGKHDYQGAAVAYGDAYQRLKGGSRGQDALIGLANSLEAIGEKPASCGALDQLRIAYPSPRRDVREAAAAARGRAGCR